LKFFWLKAAIVDIILSWQLFIFYKKFHISHNFYSIPIIQPNPPPPQTTMNPKSSKSSKTKFITRNFLPLVVLLVTIIRQEASNIKWLSYLRLYPSQKMNKKYSRLHYTQCLCFLYSVSCCSWYFSLLLSRKQDEEFRRKLKVL